MIGRPGLPISDGLGQDTRFLAALKEGYFHVDERTFESLLAMSAEFASNLNFFNLHNERDGNWSQLFNSDATATMAHILSTDLRRWESEFLERSELSVEGAAAYIVGMARHIDTWFTCLNAVDDEPGKALGAQISQLIGMRLAADLQAVRPFLSRPNERAENQSFFADLDVRWRVTQVGATTAPPRSGPSELSDSIQAKSSLYAIFHRFVQAIEYVKDQTRVHFQSSLCTQNHDPAMGLFIAFARLFRHVQDHVNRFTQRHFQFYYDRVLHVVPRNVVAGSIHLVCEAASGIQDALIEKGTEFVASGTEGRLFRSDNYVRVTDAKVTALSTLYLQRDPLISPESELHYITDIYLRRLPIAVSPAGDTTFPPSPIFGAGESDAGQHAAEQAIIGFAVASPVLLLKEGWRRIAVTVKFADPFATYFAMDEARHNVPGTALLEEISQVSSITEFTRLLHVVFSRYLLTRRSWLSPEYIRALVDKAGRLSGVKLSENLNVLLSEDREVLWHRFFNDIFTVSLTGRDGWHEVSDYRLKIPDEDDHELSIGLTCALILGPAIGPITSYNSTIHGGRWTTDAPLIRFCANEKKDISPHSLFDGLVVKEFVIETAVEGAKDLRLYNNYGQLDLSKPFQPFGALPTDNSYFIVGYAEAARKNIDALRLHIEWGEVPKDTGGFSVYYKGYDTPFSNESFQAETSVLSDGQWQPQEEEARQTISLFDTEPIGGRVSRSKVLEIQSVKYGKPVDRRMPDEEFRFDSTARNGFFKIALVAPEYAFGHEEYPNLLARILSENARLKLKLVKPIPNAPYTPIINRITLDYTATSVITVSQDAPSAIEPLEDRVFHIHPFGTEPVFREGRAVSYPLWPEYAYDGNLYIGLSARRLKGLLTLLFYIRETASHESSSVRSEPAWFYLASDRWNQLAKSRVISDTTNGFSSSGIVTLDIPDDIDRRNHIMSDDRFWLRVSADDQLQTFGQLYSVHAHAVKVSQRPEGNVGGKEDNPSRTCSIWRPVVSIPGLGKVTQVGDSFGGRSPEIRSQLQTRISERLRHKYRACVPRDYEQLILEHFPEVCKVQCFPNMRYGVGNPSPGHVLVVVVPYVSSSAAEHGLCPMLSTVVLSRISTFVQELASMFVHIEVRNPVYEQIQVRCRVKVARLAEQGVYVTMLNQALSDYISPWQNLGCKARFGWCIRRQDIESYIRRLEYVEFVTKVSMLHITQDDEGAFSLEDTVRERRQSAQSGALERDEIDDADCVRPRYPWSLPVPLKTHCIETTDDAQPIEPATTGISDLGIGSTFIIGQT
ncbi:MAG: hypothetical protein OJF50_003786 [Nitrospira sp.]|jgi:hypothetical protein|nr:hypothetical protein [Nitrospira sp.]